MTDESEGLQRSTAAAVEYVGETTDALVDLTRDLLAADSQNPPGDTTAVASVVRDAMEAVDVTVRESSVDPAKPNLLFEVAGERDLTLLYNGHLDTVGYDASEWAYDPLGERATVDGDDRVYGRGATDMKGPLAAMLHAARAYRAVDERPPVTLAYAVVSDEETGGDAGLPSVVDALDADGCVIGETTCEGGRHSVTVADRGSIWLTLDATGEGAHGSRPTLGVNAVDELWAAVTHLRDSLTERPLDVPADVDAIVERSVDYYAPIMGDRAASDTFRHPTANLGEFRGGDTINAVPESARARLDVRVVAGVDTKAVLADIRECLREHDRVELTDVSWSRGTYVPLDGPIATATAETAAAVVGERVHRRSATGGGDTKTLRNAGIPTVEFALGTDTVHALDEYTTVDALAANAEVYARLPDAFARAYDEG
ncbi:M20/M25/M40 family metallo-hydrolase [Halorubellus sp. PRR65]|uniref:M20 family metallopeptidase n=1 Tax=Halorubellus sp. PRR65 TaxID=3098148 RepID=UPI002B25AED6|nr:M20/M25/M40 family metallo-hydrolase [Halorubellus sp. PRR65]